MKKLGFLLLLIFSVQNSLVKPQLSPKAPPPGNHRYHINQFLTLNFYHEIKIIDEEKIA